MEYLRLSAASARSVLRLREDGQPFCLRYELQWMRLALPHGDGRSRPRRAPGVAVARTVPALARRGDQPLPDSTAASTSDIWPRPTTAFLGAARSSRSVNAVNSQAG